MKRKERRTVWCACGCGNTLETPTAHGKDRRFINGHNRATKTHGMTGSPEYQAYKNAKQRCSNPKLERWKDYGGRGIKFLFASFEQFFAELGNRPKGKSLDRYPNNNGHYESGNVRWATREQQQNNRRKTRTGYKRTLKTCCKRGHKYIKGSYYAYKTCHGICRSCKACMNITYKRRPNVKTLRAKNYAKK